MLIWATWAQVGKHAPEGSSMVQRSTNLSRSRSIPAVADPQQGLREALSWRDWRLVGIAAILALVLGGGLLVTFGRVSSYARPQVLTGLTDTVYWLAASTIGACATISALMLTTVGLLERLETERLTPRFLFHLRLIVTAALTTIALAVLALLLTVFPTSGAGDSTPDERVIDTVYWALLVVTALMIGGFATVLGGLSTTIGDIFRTLPRAWVEGILTESDEEQKSS
jgi:hypothetical protein